MLTPKDAILFKIVNKCAIECLILKYKYIQNPWPYCEHFWRSAGRIWPGYGWRNPRVPVVTEHKPSSTRLSTKIRSYRSSQFFNYISGVEKQVSGACKLINMCTCCEGDNWQNMKDSYILEYSKNFMA